MFKITITFYVIKYFHSNHADHNIKLINWKAVGEDKENF